MIGRADLPPAEQVGALLRTTGWGGCAGLVNVQQVQRFLAAVCVSLQAPRGVRPGRRWTVLWMWLVSYVTAAAVRPLFCFVMAVTGVTMGAASPRL